MMQGANEILDAGLWMQDEIKNLLFIQVPASNNQHRFAYTNPHFNPESKTMVSTFFRRYSLYSLEIFIISMNNREMAASTLSNIWINGEGIWIRRDLSGRNI
jgi:hypothetical protein